MYPTCEKFPIFLIDQKKGMGIVAIEGSGLVEATAVVGEIVRVEEIVATQLLATVFLDVFPLTCVLAPRFSCSPNLVSGEGQEQTWHLQFTSASCCK